MKNVLNAEQITNMAKGLYQEEKSKKRLDGWFLTREIVYNHNKEYTGLSREMRAAKELQAILAELPLSISNNAIFAGSQSDAFARSYALINPSFQVETFSGYCDPTAVYGDIEPNEEFTKERIDQVRNFVRQSDYVRTLTAVYEKYDNYTSEVAFFIEQVTGHIIPDFRPVLKNGLTAIITQLDNLIADESDTLKVDNYCAMRLTLESTIRLAHRYADIANEQQKIATPERAAQLEILERTLRKVPEQPCDTLYEALQAFMLLWEVMCLEQAPNPFAFSVGNADRIFEPYRAKEALSREEAAALFKHFLVFFNVGDRSWAISQNLIVGGRDTDGNDMTCESSYALLDAYLDMNLPQPILSAKLHKNTPVELYGSMGRFFFTPGTLTPSLFNDDSVLQILEARGVKKEDLADYAVAGCQEPLIMGKDNGNTTNSWLNLPKVLELTLNSGRSLITGRAIEETPEISAAELLPQIRERFYENLSHYIDLMCEAANDASRAISYLPVPFLSTFMGGIESGYDMRDTEHQGTLYNGSGCLIHGLSIMADSFVAIDKLIKERPEDTDNLVPALRANFEGYEELHAFLKAAPKFGNNIPEVDTEASKIVIRVSDMVTAHKNYLNNPFRADWSSPTTHLTYGYWVGATPDGRTAREQLNYGVDPLFGDADQGMGFRMLSYMYLPYDRMSGGYASHMGIDPKYFTASTKEGKGIDFANRIIRPLFFNPKNKARLAPFYLYVNVTTPDTLRKVLADPQKYAPSGVYIMRIHGTFVNFLDLSPAVQQDIIKRLDLKSTSM
ncbi:MAG: pyruvate formate lyase family protein [Oscillospiraceae bacterium]|nr:pyruvate formate lyase family protein [Oscillospiraceae bacterium]